MSSNYQQGRILTRHPGLKPAGRVIDFRKENSPQTPQETVKITCGLCQFQFDRIAKPTLLVLVCPSCGVRFEHHLPEPPPPPPKSRSESLFSTPPKRLQATLHQPLNQNLWAEAPPEEFPEPDPPPSIDEVEPFKTEAAPYEISSRISQIFDKEVQPSWSQHLQEAPKEAQWVATLITVTQSVLIAAALVALISGVSSYFRGDTKPVAKVPREIPGVLHEKPRSFTLQEPVIAPAVVAKEPPKVKEHLLPLFDINDQPVLQVQQKPVIPESEAKPEAAEEVEIDPLQQMLLQAELAAKEKQLKTLLQEQEEIQAHSRKLVSETLLRESAITLEKNPTRSLFLSLQSIQILQELGLQVSELGKTLLAQAFAAQSAGDRFIEQLPGIEALSVCSQGKWLLTSHSDRALWIWDLSKAGGEDRENVGYRIDASSVQVVDLLLTPDEHWVIGARADGLVELWNMTVDRPSEAKMVLREQVPGLSRVQISPDGRWLVAYGHQLKETQSHPIDRNGVWMWDMNTLRQGHLPNAIVLRGHERPIRCLAISSDSRWLATGSEDRSVRIFDLKSVYPGGNQKVLLGHQLEITDLQFAPDGRWIATGSRDNTARIWDLQSATATPSAKILKGHNGWISSLAVSADGRWFATAGYDQSVQLWNVQSILLGNPEKDSTTIVPGQGTIQKIAFSPDSGSLITYGANQSLKVWNLTSELTADRAVEFSRKISTFSFDASGRWLILSSNQGPQSSVSLWPLKFEDVLQQAKKFKETALPTELHEREDAYARQFEQRIIR